MRAFRCVRRRVFIKATGYSDDAPDRPVAGITDAFSEFNPCHGNVPDLIVAAKRGGLIHLAAIAGRLGIAPEQVTEANQGCDFALRVPPKRWGLWRVRATIRIAQMSVAEFLSWNPGGPGKWRLLDGEPVAMAPANRSHGALRGELARLIGNHLTARRGERSVVVEPGVVPRARGGFNVRVPDLAVT